MNGHPTPSGGTIVKKCNVLVLSALVLCAAWLPAPAAEDAPLVLGVLEIRGLDTLAASAFELSKAAGAPQPKELISMMLYGSLGTLPGMGIPAEATVRAVAFQNGSDQGGLAILLPVENEGADYLSTLGQNGWKNESETPDGLLHYVAPDDAGLAWSEVYFLKRGATLVAAKTARDARLADAAKPGLPPILPVEGDVAVQIRPAALADAFGPQIAEQMDKAFKDPELPANAAAMGELYAQTYLAVARQTAEIVLGLGVADGHLNLHSRLAPVAGTTLAAWLGTLQAPGAATAVVALPEALAVETANAGNLDLLAPVYFRFLEKLMDTLPAEVLAPEKRQLYVEHEKACFAQLAGDVAFALLPPSKEFPLRLAEYVGLKDSAALRAKLTDTVQLANDMFQVMMATETNAPLPLKVQFALAEPREYREIAVDKMVYSLELGSELAALWPPAIPTKFEIELAWVPGGVLAAVGGPALVESLVDRALDGGAAPLATWPAWQAAYPDPDRNLVDVSHVALFDLVRAYLGLVDANVGSAYSAYVPEGSGNLESCSYLMDGAMSRIRIRLADIAAISAKIQEVQAKAMADAMAPAADMDAESAEAPAGDDPAADEPAPAADPAPAAAE